MHRHLIGMLALGLKKRQHPIGQYPGDGLMVYFGWPRAHEDDAERAVRSGLAIVEAVKRVAAPTSACAAC